MPAAPAPLHTSLVDLMSRPVRSQRIDQPGSRNDGGAVLVVMEHRNVEQLAQPLLDHETFRRPDVLEVDPAPALAQDLYGVDELIRIFGRNFQVDGIDIGEAFEQDGLAFHHRFCCQRAAVAEAEDGGAVGDYGDEITLGGVIEGAIFVLGDGEHRHRDARRIGQRQIALGCHRLGGDHFELARTALTVKQQRFLIGEGRTRAAAAAFGGHLNPLLRARDLIEHYQLPDGTLSPARKVGTALGPRGQCSHAEAGDLHNEN